MRESVSKALTFRRRVSSAVGVLATVAVAGACARLVAQEAQGEPTVASSVSPVPEQSILRVDLGDLEGAAALGPDRAPVTVVAFIDYQCPYCARAHATLEHVVETYGEKVRVVFKHNPLSFHPQAELAAQASLVAMVLGEFPRMHRLLLENQKQLTPEKLPGLAEAAGMDREEFRNALDAGDFAADVEADTELAKRIGVTSTPFFFVNGRPLRGARPFGVFRALIDEEINDPSLPSRWVKRLEKSSSRRQAFQKSAQRREKLSAEDLAAAAPAGAAEARLARRVVALEMEVRDLRAEVRELRKSVATLAQLARSAPQPSQALRDRVTVVGEVDLDDDAAQGSGDAKVGIVAFADYACPFSRKFARYVLPTLREKYIDTGKVRYVYRDRPLDYNPSSRGAAVAANCAGRQGAYWKMHDALYSLDGTLDEVDYEALASEIGLDGKALRECMDDPVQAREVEGDIADAKAEKLGLRVVPTFLVGRIEDGRIVEARRVSGVQTVHSLSAVIDPLLQ